ncbi:terminase small subunit [Alkalibacterium sp. f15]|uniref:terminase small subunit n=1 Tax=Alkalibacterium sp. f15 TaxID=3414029 RepID=UPI003BF7BB38
MAKLTIKQKRFADEYIIGGNASEAARKAGYSKKTANRIATENLSKPVIRSYIDKRLEELKSERVADQQEVLEFLTSIVRGEKKEQTLIGLGMGEQEITEIEIPATQRIKAAELLGKRYAMWTDKQEVSGELGVTIVDDIDE